MLVLALYLPVVGSIGILARAIGVGGIEWIAAVAWLGLFVAAVNDQTAFRCPRCLAYFYGERGFFKKQNPWAWRCQNCRLKAGDEPA